MTNNSVIAPRPGPISTIVSPAEGVIAFMIFLM
jgi:hypothetical protein